MTIPNLKRVKVSSKQDLVSWLAKHQTHEASVMLVTLGKASGQKHISHDQVQDALAAHGWISGRKYTLAGNLVGHVIQKASG